MKQLKLKFLQECTANLDLVLASLSAVGIDPSNETALKNLFRGVHSIKGGAGFFDLDRIGHLAAAMEDVCGALASGTAVLTHEVVSALGACTSTLSGLIEAAELDVELVQGYEFETLGRLSNLLQHK